MQGACRKAAGEIDREITFGLFQFVLPCALHLLFLFFLFHRLLGQHCHGALHTVRRHQLRVLFVKYDLFVLYSGVQHIRLQQRVCCFMPRGSIWRHHNSHVPRMPFDLCHMYHGQCVPIVHEWQLFERSRVRLDMPDGHLRQRHYQTVCRVPRQLCNLYQ
jgi:hypothetical protein